MENVLKELTINEANYQIVKMSAQSGSWLLMLLMGKLMDIMSKEATPTTNNPELDKPTSGEDVASAAISFMLMKLDEDTFVKVQIKALSVCYKTVEGVPMPIVMKDGRWVDTKLQYDIETVMQLTSQAIKLNLSPFFAKGKLMGLATSD
jgi:hypothetical protein